MQHICFPLLSCLRNTFQYFFQGSYKFYSCLSISSSMPSSFSPSPFSLFHLSPLIFPLSFGFQIYLFYLNYKRMLLLALFFSAHERIISFSFCSISCNLFHFLQLNFWLLKCFLFNLLSVLCSFAFFCFPVFHFLSFPSLILSFFSAIFLTNVLFQPWCC